MEDDAETATLEAVTAFIDDYYAEETVTGSSNASVSSDDVTTTSSDDGAASKKRKPVSLEKHLSHNRGRERQKRELQSLRQEEEVLRARVTELVKARAARLERHRVESTRTDVRSLALQTEMMTVWKEMATRQYQRRKRSEDENTRLRERVIEQREVIKSLQRILERQFAETNDPTASSRLYMPSWRAVCADGDPCRMMRIFAELTADLKNIYAQSDSWVQASSLSSLVAGRFTTSRIISLTATSVAVESMNLRLLPYDFKKVGQSYWIQGINSYCHCYDYFRENTQVDGHETVFCGQAFHDGDISESSANIRLRSHMSVQKHEEDTRTVIAHTARSETISIGEQELSDTLLREQYWNIFQPPEPSVHDACLVMSCGRVIVDLDSDLSKSPIAMMSLVKYFGTRFHDHIDRAFGLVEDWLLENMVN
ncbi:hypothetical protein Poli38472_007532 [Pythium oligandrum]|uniref:Uncharacterized protein n=1 Tax=Pythium oligandrum TaxID=41045 RepID=A0A8K1FL53_PYTOL|nr:hypothetical protein Poli38472_007532 [Pythium oligandrum]|eukprot:TMW67860.1 hypothetical protein Poli38472_007532 [Pythium oligandrum]